MLASIRNLSIESHSNMGCACHVIATSFLGMVAVKLQKMLASIIIPSSESHLSMDCACHVNATTVLGMVADTPRD